MSQEVERPRTARSRPRSGYRIHQIEQQSQRAVVHSDSHGRPKSSRGRAIVPNQMHYEYYAHNTNASPVSNPSNESIPVRQPVYVPLKDESQNEPPVHRPKSSRGRRRDTQDSPDFGQTQRSDASSERPQSSRGRSMRSDDQSENVNTEYGQASPSPRARRARPKSAKGRNRNAFRSPQPSYHVEQAHNEANVLVLDEPSSSPQQYSSCGQATNVFRGSAEEEYIDPQYAQFGTTTYEHQGTTAYEQNPSYHQGHGDVFAADTNNSMHQRTTIAAQEERPSTASRPMSGRSSARPPTATERRAFNDGASKDSEFLRSGTPVSARPDSASSFSRYNILPSIGLRALAAQNNVTAPAPQQQAAPALYREPIQREATIYREPTLYREQTIYREPSKKPQRQTTSEGILTSRSVVQAGSQSATKPETEVKVATDTETVVAEQVQNLNIGGLTPIKIPTDDVISNGGHLNDDATDPTLQNTVANSQYTSGNIDSSVKSNAEDEVSTEPMYPVLTRNIELPKEPPEGDGAILLAIKLPNGRRVQRRFLPSDTLIIVLHFAEFSAQLDFTGTEIVCDAPRKVFSDLSLKICDTGLQNRTVIHIQTPDT